MGVSADEQQQSRVCIAAQCHGAIAGSLSDGRIEHRTRLLAMACIVVSRGARDVARWLQKAD